MRIVRFDKRYANEMAALFAKVFSEPDPRHQWSVTQAKRNLKTYYTYYADCCLMAMDKNVCMGALFGLINPYYQGAMLLITALIVKKEFRRSGVARALLTESIQWCKRQKLTGIKLMADARKDFPRGWYQRNGFVNSGWVEMEMFFNSTHKH